MFDDYDEIMARLQRDVSLVSFVAAKVNGDSLSDASGATGDANGVHGFTNDAVKGNEATSAKAVDLE